MQVGYGKQARSVFGIALLVYPSKSEPSAPLKIFLVLTEAGKSNLNCFRGEAKTYTTDRQWKTETSILANMFPEVSVLDSSESEPPRTAFATCSISAKLCLHVYVHKVSLVSFCRSMDENDESMRLYDSSSAESVTSRLPDSKSGLGPFLYEPPHISIPLAHLSSYQRLKDVRAASGDVCPSKSKVISRVPLRNECF